MRFLLFLFLIASSALAEESPQPTPEPELRRTVERLRQRLDADEEKLARQQQQIDRQAEEIGRQSQQIAQQSLSPSLFRLGGLSVRLSGFVQVDAVAYDSSSVDELDYATGQPLNNTRFLIRRARLRVDADYKYAGGALEFDGNTVSGVIARITNAEVFLRLPGRHRPKLTDGQSVESGAGPKLTDGQSVESGAGPKLTDGQSVEPPLLMLVAGLTRIPFGFEVQQLDWVRLFLERSNVARALFPGEFDLGAKLQGGWRWLRWQLAVMNGQPSGDKQFALRDPAKSKDLLGRVGADTPLGGRVRLSVGVSGLWGTGFHAGTAATKDTLVWHDTNLDGQVDPSEITGVLGMPGTPSKLFNRWALGGDVRVTAELPVVGELALYGELTWAVNLDRALYPADPIAAGRDLRELGWYLAATQQLTRWAAVGIRYDQYNPDADKSETIAAQIVPRDLTLSTWSLVAAAMYAPYARLTLEWDHNKNAMGRAPSGAPATLGADQVTFRAQVLF